MTEADEREVVDPHHAIRTAGITVAIVRCEEATCPRSHFYHKDKDAG